MSEQTRYSDDVPGDETNYEWPVQFDKIGGVVGITQTGDHHKAERVLLSRKQLMALIKFAGIKLANP